MLIRHSSATGPLESLVNSGTPPKLLRQVLQRLQQLLQPSPSQRQNFVTSGALMRMQGLTRVVGSGTELEERIKQIITGINNMYPADVVQYYAQQQ